MRLQLNSLFFSSLEGEKVREKRRGERGGRGEDEEMRKKRRRGGEKENERKKRRRNRWRVLYDRIVR